MTKISKLKPKLKVWLCLDEDVILGEGRLRLLKLIDSTGSISEAAKQMNLPYRTAWGKIKNSEKRLGKKLLDINKGGYGGGGSSLTPFAKKLIADYELLKEQIQSSAAKKFKQIFK